jgi:hypothetical protein
MELGDATSDESCRIASASAVPDEWSGACLPGVPAMLGVPGTAEFQCLKGWCLTESDVGGVGGTTPASSPTRPWRRHWSHLIRRPALGRRLVGGCLVDPELLLAEEARDQ